MYLPDKRVNALLDDLNNKLLTPNSSIIISFKENTALSKPSAYALKNYNENFFCTKSPNEVLSYINAHRYSMIGKILSPDFQAQAHNDSAVKHYGHDHRYILKEHYFILRPSSSIITQTFESIPNIIVDVPSIQGSYKLGL